MANTPNKKRSRPNYDPSLLATVWDHWNSYYASGGEDTDELTALLEQIASVPHVAPPPAAAADVVVEDWLPVVVSIATYLVGDDDDASSAAHRAIRWWPCHLAAWCSVLQTTTTTKGNNRAAAYRWVAQQARLMRDKGLEWRAQEQEKQDANSTVDEQEENDRRRMQQQPPVVELIDTLFLYHGLGVECLDEAEEEDEATDEDNEEGEEKAGDEDSGAQWSNSIVEATARTMAATLFSLAGQHDSAATELQYLDCTHRLHPNVWNTARHPPANDEILDLTSEPAVFAGPILPPAHFAALVRTFAPEAPFWKESDYDQRGYYSFYIPRLSETAVATDLIQDVIENYLLPLMEANMQACQQRIVGYEWWVHTRPVSAHLGHNLHFDSDETLLNTEGNVAHPLLSSVLYLDTAQGAGPTIVLDQTSAPSDGETASSAAAGDAEQPVWRNEPKSNSYLVFPGNRLHGVLPCSDVSTSSSSDETYSFSEMQAKFSTEHDGASSPPKSEQKHRTSFMVGYWTSPRSSPASSDDDDLYGPCHPLPPPASHTWVGDIQKDYPRTATVTRKATAAPVLRPSRLPSVSPAWQVLKEKEGDEELLPIPPSVDHLYFVTDPETCFRERLFLHL